MALVGCVQMFPLRIDSKKRILLPKRKIVLSEETLYLITLSVLYYIYRKGDRK